MLPRRTFLHACAAASAARRLPNLVVILADDLGYGDLSCYNPESKLPTPHADALARQGTRFTDAHSSSAVCSPTRYNLLTGRYAWRGRLQSGVLAPFDPPLIEAGRLTLPAMLRERGYRTACIGKWHLGWNWPKSNGGYDFTRPIADGPLTRGFDLYFGTDVPNYPPYCFIRDDRTVGLPSGEKTTKDLDGRPGPMLPGWEFDRILPALVEEARGYVRSQARAGRPFFLYLPLTSPHEPIAPSARFRGKSGINPVADFILETDWAAGQVLSALEEEGIAGDTLAIFTSDNGHATYTGLPELLEKGHQPSGPLRGYKTSIYEGGHRVPFIARWPGRIPAGAVCHHTVCLGDLVRTFAELTGARLPAGAAGDSISLLPLFENPHRRQPARDSLIHHSAAGQFAIRSGPWKLILPLANPAGNRKSEGDAPQLFNLSRDLAEREDLAAREPARVARLAALLEKQRAAERTV